MKAIKINSDFELFGVEFKKDLFLTDDDVRKILIGNPNKHQGFYTKIPKVTNMHAEKIEKLIRNLTGYSAIYFTIYNIS